MKKEDLLAMGLTEEQTDKVMDGLNGDFVTKSRFNEVNTELKAARTALSERDKQLEELKKVDAAALQDQITQLQADNKQKDADYAAQLKALKISNAVELALTGAKAKNNTAAKALLDACGYTAAEIGTDKLADLPGVVRAKGAGTLCEALGVGEPTLNDIVAELCKPGRDVRDSLPKPLLRSDVMGLDDLKPGMELTGTVRNVIDFGAFVDLGVHQDGLVHVSQISDKFIKHPREVLKVGDIVRVKVLNVDTAKKRIALTMKGVPQQN